MIYAEMELAHSLLLNEEALTKIPDAKRPVFIFEWLRFLDKVLVAAQKVDVLFRVLHTFLITIFPIFQFVFSIIEVLLCGSVLTWINCGENNNNNNQDKCL